jgi:hypothetical protein
MSAEYPVTAAEKAAQAWAEGLDQTPEQMVRWIYRLRDEQKELIPQQHEAHKAYQLINAQAEETHCRVEALKLRLMSSL